MAADSAARAEVLRKHFGWLRAFRLSDPGAVLGGRDISYPGEIDEAYSGDYGRRCS
jgi:hypothetical protein